MDLFSSIEKVIERIEGSHLNEELFKEENENLDYICSKMKLTREQAVMFLLYMDNAQRNGTKFETLCELASCSMIKVLKHKAAIDYLLNRHLLVHSDNTYGHYMDVFDVPMRVINMLKDNKDFGEDEEKNLSIERLFEVINEILKQRCNKGITTTEALSNLQNLFENNQHLGFCKQMLSMNKRISEYETLMFIIFCNTLVTKDENELSHNDISNYFDHRVSVSIMLDEISEESGDLYEGGLIEQCCEDGFMGSTFQLGETALRDFLYEIIPFNGNRSARRTINSRELIRFDSIKGKQMYYSGEVKKHIADLTSMLSKENFKRIKQRLAEHNMQKGLTILFYGGPGNGKTESALQIAKQTGRNIFKVDISTCRDKYVGETEKAIKSIFNRYRRACEASEVAPILLLNEADAILTKRNSNAQQSVDKMENAMANIILDEMENLDGILIATTNLTENMDDAFERRWLWKVEFTNPNKECRKAIWKSKIESLTDDAAEQLAISFNFSPGEIENISRKHIVNSILFDKEENNLNTIIDFCRNERIRKQNERKIGF